jgi:hypothetical protein
MQMYIFESFPVVDSCDIFAVQNCMGLRVSFCSAHIAVVHMNGPRVGAY